MSHCLYAVLVGINNYPNPAHRLSGCVNDIDGWKLYLSEYARKTGYHFKPLILLDEAATRQAIVSGFANHLTQARGKDLAVFCFAGHGSELSGQDIFGQRPDERNQTLVCWDSREPGNRDLVDKEISNLVAEVAEHGPQITLIMDCCHSGSISREVPFKERQIEPQLVRNRPSDAYFMSSKTQCVEDVSTRDVSNSDRTLESGVPFQLKKGRHILLSACHERETAKETLVNGVSRGIFSEQMQKMLTEATRPMTYTELLAQVQHEINTREIPAQVPQLEVIDGEEGDRDCFFLTRKQQAESDGIFTLSYQEGWIVDGGGVHGWPEGVGDPGIELAVFSFADAPEDIKQGLGRVAIAHVDKVQSTSSQVSVEGHGLDTACLYKALVTKMPMSNELTVFLHGNEAGVEALRLSLSKLDGHLVKVQEVNDASAAMIVLKAAAREYEIFRGAALQEPMTVPVAVRRYHPPLPTDVEESLVKIWRWLELRNLTKAERNRPVDVELKLLQQGKTKSVPDLCFNCQLQGNRWLVPDIKFQISNHTSVPIYCAVLYLSPEFGISPDLMEAGGLWVEPGSIGETIDFDLAIPEVFVSRGVSDYPTVFKLIVSNQQFNARIWYQEELEKTGREIIPKRKNQDFWITKEVIVRCAIPNQAAAEAKTEFEKEPMGSEGIDPAAEIAELWAMDEADLLVELGRLVERSPIVTERPIEMGEVLVRSPIVTERPAQKNNSMSIHLLDQEGLSETFLEKGHQLFSQISDKIYQALHSPDAEIYFKSALSTEEAIGHKYKAQAVNELQMALMKSFDVNKNVASICSILLIKQSKLERSALSES